MVGAALLSPFLLLRSHRSKRLGVRIFFCWKNRWQTPPKPTPEIADWLSLAVVVGSSLALTLLSLRTVLAWAGTSNFYAAILIAGLLPLFFTGAVSVCFPTGLAHVIGWSKRNSSITSLAAGAAIVMLPLCVAVERVADRSPLEWIALCALLTAIFASVFWATRSSLELSNPHSTNRSIGRLALATATPMAIGYGVGVLAVALAARTAATIRHLPEGLASLSSNYRRIVMCESVFAIPELIPGLEPHKTGFRYSAVRLAASTADARAVRMMNWLLIALWFPPSVAYKISLKSTWWAWWSFYFIGKPPSFEHDPRHVYEERLRIGALVLPFLAVLNFLTVSVVQWLINPGNSFHVEDGLLVSALKAVLETPRTPAALLAFVFGLVPFLARRMTSRHYKRYSIARGFQDKGIVRTPDEQAEADVVLAESLYGLQRAEWVWRVGYLCSFISGFLLIAQLTLSLGRDYCFLEGFPHWARSVVTLFNGRAPTLMRCPSPDDEPLSVDLSPHVRLTSLLLP